MIRRRNNETGVVQSSADQLGELSRMITGFGDQMPRLDNGVGKLLVKIAGDQQVTEAMINAKLDTLRAHLEGRQQDHAVDLAQAGST